MALIQNKAFCIKQDGRFFTLYRLIRNADGEVIAQSLVGTYHGLPSAVLKMLEQGQQGAK